MKRLRDVLPNILKGVLLALAFQLGFTMAWLADKMWSRTEADKEEK